MTATWPCGHPYTAKNTRITNTDRPCCRECHLAYCRYYNARTRGKDAERPRKPIEPVAPEVLSAEAYGSRRLLEGYAAYYERHVAPTA